MKKVIDKNLVWNAIGISLNSFNSLFFLIAIKRINGLSDSGIFSYAFALCCLFFYISIFYNRTYQVSDFNNKYTFNQYFTSRLITIVFSILSIYVFSLISNFNFYKISIIVLLMCFRSVEALAECFYAEIQKNNMLYITGISMTIKTIVGFLLFFVMDYFTNSIELSLVIYSLFNIFIIIIFDLKYFKICYKEKISLDFSKIIDLLKNTFSLCAFTVLSLYIINCQKYIMTYSLSDDLQSIFGMIIMPGTIMSLFGSYLLMPYVNQLADYFKNRNIKMFSKVSIRICGTVIILGLLSIIAAYLIGIPVLNIIFNIDLSVYKMCFIILLIGAILSAVCVILSNLLTILRDNNNQLIIYIIVSITTTVVSYFLINSNGLFGASIAYFLSQLLCTILFIILYRINIRKLNGE